jgi:hypothetical protein
VEPPSHLYARFYPIYLNYLIAYKSVTCYGYYMAGIRVTLIVLLAGLLIAGLSNHPTPAAAAPKPTDVPTTLPPTVDPGQGAQTPTPWVVLLITPTPEYRPLPPSLNIPGFKDKIKSFGSSARRPLYAYSPAPRYADASIPVEIDQAIATWMPWVISRQNDYRSFSGRYVQMMPSHTTTPTLGDQDYPDRWYDRPTDTQWSWDDLNAIRYEPLPFTLSIDVYDGPDGIGFVTCFDVAAGSIWRRCINYGPEALRSHPWQVIQ